MGEGPQRLDDLLAGERLLLTTEEAADLLRVGRTTIYGLIKAGELHSLHIGRSCRISRAELERYVCQLQAPDPVPSRSPARKRTPTDQGGLLELGSDAVGGAAAVDSRPSASHRPSTLDAVDEQRQGSGDDGLRGTRPRATRATLLTEVTGER